ncbi:MAG TPA: FliH/SctL family protein [Bryobacteraceae bacterium]|jgi:flagellar assembly protein FliH|nr:FliH/SctL family protein [Bryobacteraceae bacterium]
MACKIADNATSVKAVTWPSRLRTLPARRAPAIATQTQSESEGVQLQLAELEKGRQAELARTRQLAFDDGVKKGHEDAAVEIGNANERLAATLRDLHALKKKIRHEAEADVVKLSLAIARRILHRELNADPDSIHGLVYAGLQKLQNREISQLRVAPGALEPVRRALEKVGAFPAITISPDPRLQGGDVIFETALGELDASVETQLHEIERGFADRLGISCS